MPSVRHAVLAQGFLVILSLSSQAQPTWHDSTARGPNAWRHAMTFDELRSVVVLHTGWLFNETWEFDGIGWRKIAVPSRIPVRFGHAMAYCAANQRVVLYGGANGGTLSDTWEYDGTDWRLSTAAPRGMVSRAFHAMASDLARQRVVVFGGLTCPSGTNCTTYLKETWEYDGARWLRGAVAPAGLSPRVSFGMSYDSARDRVVVFGGQAAPSVFLNDTWEYDGTSWAAGPSPPAGLTPRDGCRMAYDVGRGRHVLFGGRTSSAYTNETWEFDGSTWTPALPGTTPRYEPALTYDSVTGRIVLNGGYPYAASPTSEYY